MNLKIHFHSDQKEINSIAEVTSLGDYIRIMHPESHKDFTALEMRWTEEELALSKNGIFVGELSLSPNDLAGLHLVKDPRATSFMLEQDYGKGLKHVSKRLVNAAPLLVNVFADGSDHGTFLRTGRLMEELWLCCTRLNLGVQIINVPHAFLLRYKHNDLDEMHPTLVKEVQNMVDNLQSVIPDYMDKTDMFTMRIFPADPLKPVSVRKELGRYFGFWLRKRT